MIRSCAACLCVFPLLACALATRRVEEAMFRSQDLFSESIITSVLSARDKVVPLLAADVATVSDYVRITAYSIILFDWIATVPEEYALYLRQWHKRRISLSCALFFLVRYLSILALILNAVGQFKEDFSPAQCRTYYMVPQAFKVISGWAAEMIIFMRTLAIGGNRRTALFTLCALALITAPVQIFGQFYSRAPLQKGGNCTSTTAKGAYNSAPWYPAANLFFDIGANALATWYIVAPTLTVGYPLQRFTRLVLQHGLLYAFATSLTNLIILLASLHVGALSGINTTIGITITSILAQRIVLITHRLLLTPDPTHASGTGDAYKRSPAHNLSPPPANQTYSGTRTTTFGANTGSSGDRDPHGGPFELSRIAAPARSVGGIGAGGIGVGAGGGVHMRREVEVRVDNMSRSSLDGDLDSKRGVDDGTDLDGEDSDDLERGRRKMDGDRKRTGAL